MTVKQKPCMNFMVAFSMDVQDVILKMHSIHWLEKIYGPNNRLMINLVCRRRGRNTQAINFIFLINIGSPISYLSEKAMNTLIGNPASHLPEQLQVSVHSKEAIKCYLSPRDKHFADVNVLGMDFLVANRLTLKVNCRTNICTLMVEENE